MQRTIRIQLEPSPVQADALAETSRQFTAAFNLFAHLGWSNGVSNATKLHFLAYYPVRDALPDLNSNLANTARAKAAEALRSAFRLRKDQDRKVSMPRSVACPPRYNIHTYRLDWESQTVRMSLVGGRQTIRFRVLDYATKYAGYPSDTADLVERDGAWWLHVVVSVPAPDVAPEGQVIGVDLGINRPAVASNNRFLGQRRWKAIEGRYFKSIRALQKKGTKSAKRHLRHIKRRRARFRKDADHVLSKQIVAAAEPGGTIVLENLKDIRKRMKAKRRTIEKRRMHSWPFASLTAKIEYKAEDRGCTVVAVDPRQTSQACSRCGQTARNNRRSQSVFICRQCGYQLNADLNAARNIAAKYRAGGGTSPDERADSIRKMVDCGGSLVGAEQRAQDIQSEHTRRDVLAYIARKRQATEPAPLPATESLNPVGGSRSIRQAAKRASLLDKDYADLVALADEQDGAL